MKQLGLTVAAVVGWLLFAGCAPKADVLVQAPFSSVLSPQESVAVATFENHTQTPDAGKRAASFATGVLRAQGYRVAANARYVLRGEVNEWRYKVGVDGEPAVSVTLRLVDKATHRVRWSAVASGNGWSDASLGTTAQRLFEETLR